ncbi:MAG TPA: glycoside hydrolase family 31 protein [Bacteroides mediterraneensis]|uniref:glycoside hydrolase family 31 protein n=1 Tax=Bacteroides mediterraneensis TaxID=1841856 RepID=UPI0026E98A51|nr:TIM-barrel domain-containing protein [Bacteroides mediterraneensis]HJH63634.1 glycoside hydrolase family 31 protein [Bacteroides mediterraneensis]
MRQSCLFLLFFFVCVWWNGDCLAGNVLGLSSDRQIQAWTLEEKRADQVVFRRVDTRLRLIPLTGSAVRVVRSKGIAHELPELVYLPVKAPVYTLKMEGEDYILSLKDVSVKVSASDGRISFLSSDGKVILGEEGGQLQASSVQGEQTYVSTQTFHSPSDEYLYGLGQFQDGYLNVRGLTRRLTQVNTQIAVPFVMSNKGYGLLWNNYGLTDFNPASSVIALQKTGASGDKVTVNVTSTEGGKEEVRGSNVFAGSLKVESDGQYALMLDVGSSMARRHNLEIDGHTVVDVNNLWLPPTVSVLVDLKAGVHRLKAELTKEDTPKLFFRKVDQTTTFRSPVSNGIDYTFFAGTADEVIASYRAVTGEVPMLPAWALGYIHCRERFHSQKELLETASRFRREKLPVDLMVQDWQYWGRYGWSAMRFDEADYPSPREMVDSLHRMDMRLMLSVWSKVDQNSVLGKKMAEKAYYIPGTPWIDFFNPEAASFYWQNFRDSLVLPIGIDAWWLDATEPENDDLVGRRVNHSSYPGEVFRNVYPLVVNKTVYEGLRSLSANGEKQGSFSPRTVLLTRSGFPGIQRYGVATWSGDVGNDWDTFRRQIVAGLGISVCGLPWWTYDAGGFFRPGDAQYTDVHFHERFSRWLQTSVFLPLMRVHGYMTNTEFWNYGDKVTEMARKSLALRYRLLPYIYSESAWVSLEDGTMLRPLVMDFPLDTLALSLKYQYMFGRSLLVSPIVEEGPAIWKTYLPAVQGGWYDFYDNRHLSSGWVQTSVSPDYIPVFVKSGTILPLASGYADEADTALQSEWEIRVYTGTDGTYQLYEDNGTDCEYEKGACSCIRLTWNEKDATLVIGKRKGTFAGMKPVRKLKIVKVASSSNGAIEVAEKSVVYKGEELEVAF